LRAFVSVCLHAVCFRLRDFMSAMGLAPEIKLMTMTVNNYLTST